MSIRSANCLFWSMVVLSGAVATACGQQHPAPGVGSGDPAFGSLARDILADHYKRHPSHATDLGIHTYDAFIKLGPLPLPLIRKAMLGGVGTLL